MAPNRSLSDLLYFESVDLLERKFAASHSRSLNRAKGREIASHFRQGREFFETARDAPPLVKPLLLYYGVLSWTRGLILFQDPRLRESGLRKAHGLTAYDWQAALAKGMRNVGDLEIRVETGTFSQLTAATLNTEGFRGGRWKSYVERGATRIEPGTMIRAREVWARLPRLAAVYEETFGESSYLYRDSEALTDPRGTVLFLRPLWRGATPIEPEEIRRRLQLPESVLIERISWSKGYEYQLLLHEKSAKSVWNWADHLWGYDSVVAAPFAGNLRLSRLSNLFMSAYILGMLVRYHPTQWADLIHRGEGDVAMPLIREATDCVEFDFPQVLAEALHMLPGCP